MRETNPFDLRKLLAGRDVATNARTRSRAVSRVSGSMKNDGSDVVTTTKKFGREKEKRWRTRATSARVAAPNEAVKKMEVPKVIEVAPCNGSRRGIDSEFGEKMNVNRRRFWKWIVRANFSKSGFFADRRGWSLKVRKRVEIRDNPDVNRNASEVRGQKGEASIEGYPFWHPSLSG